MVVGYSRPYLQIFYLYDPTSKAVFDVGTVRKIQLLKDANLVALMRDQDLCVVSGIQDGVNSLSVVARLPHFFTDF